ncbi:phosphotransferase [Fodinicola feengrottensis]|uniref:phosphotransferase n=1 Tax=Fodinicola feengrottensis TaxID=435914 RepID=UPI0013D5B6B3|nr:phosphotransferase [Fodinicola feengrottensis]
MEDLNLSCLFTLNTVDGLRWAKAAPAFGNSEADVIEVVRRYDPALVPTVLAADRATKRTLLANAPGEGCWKASTKTACEVIQRWVAVQAAIGEPDLVDLPAVDPVISTRGLLAGEAGGQLTQTELAAAYELLDQLPKLLAEQASAELPPTLVHGDFHPGNWHSDGTTHTIRRLGRQLRRQPGDGRAQADRLAAGRAAGGGPYGMGGRVAYAPAPELPRARACSNASHRSPAGGRHVPALPGRHRAGRARLPRR